MIMGHDAYMEVDNDLKIYADSGSTKYKDKINNGVIDPSLPFIFLYSRCEACGCYNFSY